MPRGIYVTGLEIDRFERTLCSNLVGQVLCCKHFVRHRRQCGGGGKIINVTSFNEDVPNPGGWDYNCSKSADPHAVARGRRARHQRQ